MTDMKTKIEVTVVIVVLSLMAWFLLSEFIAPSGTTIRSQEDVSKAVTNISSNIEDISYILDDIDQSLG